MKNLQLDEGDLKDLTYFKKSNYTRNLLEKNSEFELIVLCWEKGHKTPVHDHNGSLCWTKVIEGEVLESVYKRNLVENWRFCSPVANTTNLKKGAVSFISDKVGFHSFECRSLKAVSLHLYCYPIEYCHTYDLSFQTKKKRELSYDSVQGMIVS